MAASWDYNAFMEENQRWVEYARYGGGAPPKPTAAQQVDEKTRAEDERKAAMARAKERSMAAAKIKNVKDAEGHRALFGGAGNASFKGVVPT